MSCQECDGTGYWCPEHGAGIPYDDDPRCSWCEGLPEECEDCDGTGEAL